MENSLDPVHTEWQHGKYQEFWEEQRGSKYAISRKHLKIDFAEFEHGVYKRRLLAGASEDSDDWKVGHPVLFPNILAVGSGGGKLWKMQTYQMRVPIDDENSMHYWYTSYDAPEGLDVPAKLRERIPYYEVRWLDDNGENDQRQHRCARRDGVGLARPHLSSVRTRCSARPTAASSSSARCSSAR